jgi:hypothetical protein
MRANLTTGVFNGLPRFLRVGCDRRGAWSEIDKGPEKLYNIRVLLQKCSGVAQLAEQGIHKPWVAGSSPAAANDLTLEVALLCESDEFATKCQTTSNGSVLGQSAWCAQAKTGQRSIETGRKFSAEIKPPACGRLFGPSSIASRSSLAAAPSPLQKALSAGSVPTGGVPSIRTSMPVVADS